MALTAPTYDHTGKKLAPTTLNTQVFSVKASPHLLALAVKAYLANQRQATRAVKTRGQVDYSTAKLWRQKGTGRARHGSRRAPIFVGGGVAHGPTGKEQYRQKLTQKMRRKALLASLSQKQTNHCISIVKNVDKVPAKSKAALNLVQQIAPDSRKILLILHQPIGSLIQAARNLPHVTTTQVKRLNTYEVLNHHHLIFTQESLQLLPQTTVQIKPKQVD